jgi:hypothetical protein
MGLRLEASGVKGANSVTVEAVDDDDPKSDVRHVRIRVRGRNGEIPTMPFFPEGMVYTDRTGGKYTILAARVTEVGPPGGEQSIWVYDYLAAIGAHRLSGLQV